jgi:hypothetical protein
MKVEDVAIMLFAVATVAVLFFDLLFGRGEGGRET